MKIMSFLLALLFFVHESVFAQASVPDTPAAAQLSAWLAAFNTGDRTILLKFLEKNEPERVSHVDETMSFRARTGDIFGPEFEQHRLELRTLQDYVKLYGTRDATFEPGSRWAYSNYGFILLGRIVEKASSQDYYQYVREHIFDPAGMNSTDSLPEDQAVANRSVGYMSQGDSNDSGPNDGTLPYRGTSAGGGYSTVADLLAFANALIGHKLLDAEHTALLTTGKVDTP